MTAAGAHATMPIVPPATIGILGGGQLGRYFVVAARTMGYRTVVLEPDPRAPAGSVADVHLVAAYDDPDALATMSAQCAVVTTEFENPPAAALNQLSATTPVRPSAAALQIAQDRRAEKRFLTSIGVPIGPYAVITEPGDIEGNDVMFPAILKTARLGYDGKGQITVADHGELTVAWERLGGVPCVLEQRLTLERELSIVLARGVDGASAAYPVAHNIHVGGILDFTVVGAADPHAENAARLASSIATALDYVGVLAVEMFVVDDRLLVNELAPRPHNSGHWTLDGAATNQFEQQVRAVCGLTLGDPSLLGSAAAMVNLLGDLWEHGEPDWAAALGHPEAHLHLYGKHHARPGRKMGHLTIVAAATGDARPDTTTATRNRALALRSHACVGLQLDL
jgi:5-(carboxyamino)imidazole ribonucleotide synthase